MNRVPRLHDRCALWASAVAVTLTLACDSSDSTKPTKMAMPVKQAKPQKAATPPAPAASAAELQDRLRPLMSAMPAVAESPDNPLTDAKIELGRMLYFETRLSKNHDVACATCHDLDSFGIDARQADGKRVPTSPGHKGQLGERNSPTVYNAGFHVAQFWDGRAADLEDQAKGPVLNPVEMAMPDEAAVVAVLQSIPGYADKFKAAFPDAKEPITYDNMANAIGAFERKLVTPSRFDEFLAGKAEALDAKELSGLQLFLDVGCTLCHVGSAVGGTQFQKMGTVKPWPGLKDVGRMTQTNQEIDKFVFKVASLRNVTETGPYLHDGSMEDLTKVVMMMAEHQTARGKLEASEAEAIVAFLGALRGEIPKDYIAKPDLPPSGPDTPKPNPA